MNYAYVRVSVKKQTVKNQKLVIKEFCKNHRITKLNWISETISGTKNTEKRKLGKLINLVNEGDVVVITELSRLGRTLIMIFNVLQIFLEKKVKVIAIKENYELGHNIQSKVIAFAFDLSAEIERQLISERTKAGLERARKNGKQLGRRNGSCILNVILCYCMGYFYFDSSFCVPLVYAAFFFLYIIVVFLTGRRFVPFMYMLYCLGGVQNITFINLTGWFIVIGLS